MSKHVAKSMLRQAYVTSSKSFDIVREATSNDPWGPSGAAMAEIAECTHNPAYFLEIMDMIDKRLNDHGKNWRHVFKALSLLDYCLHCGSENVITYARENMYVIKTLKEFQFIDEDGKDQGANVRQKSRDITTLLADENRLREARSTRQQMLNRIGTSGSSVGHRGSIYDSTAAQEQRDLERAIEESRRTAAEHERRLRARGEELQHAIEASQQQQAPIVTSPPVTDLLDFSSEHNAVVPFNPNASSTDPFGFSTPQQQQHPNLGHYQQQLSFSSQHQQYMGNSVPQQAPTLQAYGTTAAPFSSNTNNTGFDGGSGFHSVAGLPANDSANARLAAIARQSASIDPFAQLAQSRGPNQATPQTSFFQQHQSSTFQQQQYPSGGSVISNQQSFHMQAISNAQFSNDPFGPTAGDNLAGIGSALVPMNRAAASTSTVQPQMQSQSRPGLDPNSLMDNFAANARQGSNGLNSTNPFVNDKKYDWSKSGGQGAISSSNKTLQQLAMENNSVGFGSGFPVNAYGNGSGAANPFGNMPQAFTTNVAASSGDPFVNNRPLPPYHGQ